MKNFSISLLITSVIAGCAANKPPQNFQGDSLLVKKWVLSRCIGHSTSDLATKQDAFNSASAYLEKSRLPVEEFSKHEAAIIESIRGSATGSVDGTFKIKSCIELATSL